MRLSDILSAGFLLVFGLVLYFLIIPDQIGSQSWGGLAPDFFPRLIARLLLILTALLLAVQLISVWRRAPHTEAAMLPIRLPELAFIGAASIVLMVAYLLMREVGYIVAAMFIIAAAGVAMGSVRRTLLQLPLMVFIAPAVIYLIFRYFFIIYLPA
ncbi:conserved hypothetical protein; putative membrane protein [Pseudorhizobium banfieldiae]|uniref:DUF1468 domain-containing protein n=1 Tax=Pseudorhizobium banfieldiae TaxID=1125847 RepID=L0NBS6_9HYPH|nr:tripartite tricarboxylate transporter TctB family protein [Pseudorhizobium banfieldiae]CAD6601980.1 hypothetical protein RNT25_01005 [arsenite-oxidising bacterium NT-25]CAD6606393.1 hypothetical protein RTCK_01848 [Rhizobium sp. TCK]CCF18334.1 conserved hypothetical protein; putative membrane protein [Pseudorhizobium banfieldiae]